MRKFPEWSSVPAAADEPNLPIWPSRLGHFGTLFLCCYGRGSCVCFVCRQKHLDEFYYAGKRDKVNPQKALDISKAKAVGLQSSGSYHFYD